MCNGLSEKFNETLKRMLKKMCFEQPRQWHRYMNPLLFACHEVPQELMGFAPFELMYGHTVPGPMHIIKELWTQELEESDIKTSYEYVFDVRERLEETPKHAQEELRQSKEIYQQ